MVNGRGFTIMTANLKIENTLGETEKDGLKDITTQGGRNWQQPFGEHKNGHKNFCQVPICYFRDKCIVFARNC